MDKLYIYIRPTKFHQIFGNNIEIATSSNLILHIPTKITYTWASCAYVLRPDFK